MGRHVEDPWCRDLEEGRLGGISAHHELGLGQELADGLGFLPRARQRLPGEVAQLRALVSEEAFHGIGALGGTRNRRGRRSIGAHRRGEDALPKSGSAKTITELAGAVSSGGGADPCSR